MFTKVLNGKNIYKMLRHFISSKVRKSIREKPISLIIFSACQPLQLKLKINSTFVFNRNHFLPTRIIKL